jgi:hypothetical protein
VTRSEGGGGSYLHAMIAVDASAAGLSNLSSGNFLLA